MTARKQPASRSHDEAVIELLRTDPEFANEYLAAAMDEANEPGGQSALLAALRHVAEAQGMAAVAQRAGIPRESLYRALGPRGNPTIKTLPAVLGAAGLQLAITRPHMKPHDVAERMGATQSTAVRLEAGKAATAGKEKGTAWVPVSVSDWLPDLGSNQGPAD